MPNVMVSCLLKLPTISIVTSSPLPGATQGSAYSATIASNGGTGPFTWSLLSATPNPGAWITINAATGVLSGTPHTIETEALVVKVTDSLGASATKNFSLAVASSQTMLSYIGGANASTYMLSGWTAAVIGPAPRPLSAADDTAGTFVASLASNGVLTVTSSPTTLIIRGALTGSGVLATPTPTLITGQLTGTPGGIGTYQTSQLGTTLSSRTLGNQAYFPYLTIGSPGYPGAGGPATGQLPVIFNQFTVAGVAGKDYGISTVSNAPPNDWLTTSIAAQQTPGVILDLVVVIANPAGPGGNPYTKSNGTTINILAPGNPVNTTFNGFLDALIPGLLKLKPFILSLPGELNLPDPNWAQDLPHNFMNASSGATTLEVAQIQKYILDRWIAAGITNFANNFEINLGQPAANRLFGCPGIVSGLATDYFDLISCDSQPIFFNGGDYTTMQSVNKPMLYGSAIPKAPPDSGFAEFSINIYTGAGTTGPNGPAAAAFITANYPKFAGAIWWSQLCALNIQNGALQAMTQFPWIPASQAPASFSRAGGFAGG